MWFGCWESLCVLLVRSEEKRKGLRAFSLLPGKNQWPLQNPKRLSHHHQHWEHHLKSAQLKTLRYTHTHTHSCFLFLLHSPMPLQLTTTHYMLQHNCNPSLPYKRLPLFTSLVQLNCPTTPGLQLFRKKYNHYVFINSQYSYQMLVGIFLNIYICTKL